MNSHIVGRRPYLVLGSMTGFIAVTTGAFGLLSLVDGNLIGGLLLAPAAISALTTYIVLTAQPVEISLHGILIPTVGIATRVDRLIHFDDVQQAVRIGPRPGRTEVLGLLLNDNRRYGLYRADVGIDGLRLAILELRKRKVRVVNHTGRQDADKERRDYPWLMT